MAFDECSKDSGDKKEVLRSMELTHK